MKRSAIIAGLLLAVSCSHRHRPALPAFPSGVLPRPGLAAVASSPWSRARVDRDGKALAIFFTGGVEPCGILDHVDVSESKTTVTITVFLGADPAYVASLKGQPLACTDEGILGPTVVHLADKLGSRRLFDGATHEVRPVEGP